MYALSVREQFSLRDMVDSEKRWVMGTGTAFHTQFQEDYLQTLGDVFQGWWRCRGCGHVHRGESLAEGMLPFMWIPRPKVCERPRMSESVRGEVVCLATDFEYVELEFEDREYRITGHCDGVLVWGDDDVELLELKTINERGFNYVDPKIGGKPRGGHVVQTSGYLWGVEKTAIKSVRVVYIKKSYDDPMSTLFSEHVIERNQDYIDSIKRSLKDAREVVEAEVRFRLKIVDEPEAEAPMLPGKLEECKRKSDYRARYCMARDSCFHKKNKKA